jgi:phage terminase large subunit GpA-like protein
MSIAIKQQTIRFTEGEKRVFRIPERISTADWAEKYRVVVDGGRKSPWRNELSPCAVGIMDALDAPFIREVYVQAAPQTVKTQAIFNYVLKRVDLEPTSAMFAMPDEKLQRRFFKRRLLPSIKSTPRTAALLSTVMGDVTRTSILFINGMDITGAWAGSSATMASDAMELVVADEVNKYPPAQNDEPNALDAIRQRTNSFPFTYKLYACSTPNNEQGIITHTIKESADVVMHYHVKCPICGEEQQMIWNNITWGDIRDPRKVLREKLARYNCKSCAMQWDDYMRDQAVLLAFQTMKDKGWIADNRQCSKCSWTGSDNDLKNKNECPLCKGQIVELEEIKRPHAVAFKLASWYKKSMSVAAANFLHGQDDIDKLKAWVTQDCAEPWIDKAINKSENAVLQRQSIYPALVVPPDVIALTCGIDVQKYGFWFVVRGWAEDLTSWLIQYGYQESTTNLKEDIETLIYKTEYKIYNSQETMKIWRAGMDTGGGESADGIWSRTEEIYQALRQLGVGENRRVFGMKGASHRDGKRIKISHRDTMPNSNKTIPGGLELRFIDTAQYKEIIHNRLSKKDSTDNIPAEKQRFYVHQGVGIDYVKQLLSEEYRMTKGKKWEWKKVYYQNHLLDCEVYSAACADAEWIPSLQMMAQYLKNQRNPATAQKAGRRVISAGVDIYGSN